MSSMPPATSHPTYRWKAFISYRHTPRARLIAEALESALRTYAIPRYRFPRRVFRDEQALRPGDPLAETIRRALTDAEYLIYLAEREAAESRWVREELETWCRDLGRAERLVIVHIADDLTFSAESMAIDWEKTNAIPNVVRPDIAPNPLIASLTEFSTPDELSLRDARFKLVVNALVAALEGTTPEDMAGKEVRAYRKNRRVLVGGICGLLALTALSVILAVVSVSQRNDALRVAKSSQLATQAIQAEPRDLTMAFAIAQRAYDLAPTSTNRRLIYGWYADRTFYAREFQHTGHGINCLAWQSQGLLVGHGPQATLWHPSGTEWAPTPLTPNSQATMAVGFLASGSEMATVGFGQAVVRWDTATGHEISRFRLPDQTDALAIASTPGALLASTLNQGLILVDIATGRQTALASPEDMQPTGSIAARHDASMFAIGLGQGTIAVLDEEGHLLARLDNHRDAITCLAFSTDGQLLVSGSHDETATIWDMRTMRRAEHLQGMFSPISAAAIRSDGRTALGSRDGRISIRGRDGSQLRRWQAHRDAVTALAFSDDGSRLASAGGTDGVVRVWAAKHRDEPTWTRAIQRFEPSVCRFSHDGTQIVVEDKNDAISVWSVDGHPTGRSLAISNPTAAALDADGRLIVGSRDGLVLDVQGQTTREPTGSVIAIDVLREHVSSNTIVVLTDDSLELRGSDLAVARRTALTGTPSSLALSPDDGRIAVGYDDGRLELRNVALDLVGSFQPHRQKLSCLAFSSSGDYIAVGSWDETVSVLRRDGERIALLVGAHNSYLAVVGFTPDERYLLTFDFSFSEQGAVWDWRGNYVVKRLRGHSHRGLCGAVSSTEGRAVTCGMDSTVRMWDLTPSLDAFLDSPDRARFTDQDLGVDTFER